MSMQIGLTVTASFSSWLWLALFDWKHRLSDTESVSIQECLPARVPCVVIVTAVIVLSRLWHSSWYQHLLSTLPTPIKIHLNSFILSSSWKIIPKFLSCDCSESCSLSGKYFAQIFSDFWTSYSSSNDSKPPLWAAWSWSSCFVEISN